jgi:crotonobetainyl-CoA:carnitine CoA-transferase CaiB-like acyl-CoA transferase
VKPFEGVRVVEVASWTFVPAAGAVLADWGADVIKVEDVRSGDPGRSLVVGGLVPAESRTGLDFMLEIGNRGKRSIGLDLRQETGRNLLARLVKTADVFLTNWLPDARRRMQIDVDDIRAMNPRIIYARGSGHGTRGPDAEKGGFDGASFMARGSVAYSLTPETLDTPIGQTPALGDLPSGMTLAGGIAAALYKRAVSGEPSVVDVSLLSQAIWTMSPEIMAAEFFGRDGGTGVARQQTALNPVVSKYRTSDSRWIQLVFLQPDRYWAPFVKRIGRPDLAADPRFATSRELVANAAAASAEIAATFAEKDLAHWLKVLADEPGVWSVVATPGEVLQDPQALENGYFIENVSDAGVPYKMAGSPVQFDCATPDAARAPEHGQHTEELLLELGCDWPEIIAAKDSGAVL